MKDVLNTPAVSQYELMSDDLLAVSSAGGDPAARQEWVSRFMPRVWRIVYLNCSTREDVEDLSQTAMITALENLGAYRGPGKFRAWLDRLTLNVVRTHYRKNRLRRLLFTPLEAAPEAACRHNTARQVETMQLFERLSAHLAKIKPAKREALVLSMIFGYGAKDIAEITGCSVEAAWKRVRRGYQDLMLRVGRDPEFRESIRESAHE